MRVTQTCQQHLSLFRLSTRLLLVKQIRSIQPHKAVPEGSAPSSVCKLCASLVASNMAAFLQRPQIALPLQGEVASSDQPGSMPTSATSADLCFIPKPGKPPSHPTSLRPLGIIRPDGKGVAGEIRVRLQSTLQQYHANMPQFAYIPGRGIQDAQLRVLAHIRRVKQVLQTHLHTKRVHKFPGHINRPHLQGGFIFSLDLSQAFDKVKRQVILDALADVGASQADIELVASLHRNITYVVKYGSSRGSLRSTTGSVHSHRDSY